MSLNLQPESKEELILSVVIFGHGCEDFLNPFPIESDIGEYYRNNVRVYSTPTVPDITSIMAPTRVKHIVDNIRSKFTDIPEAETREIVNSVKEEIRSEYQASVARTDQLGIFNTDPTFKRNMEPRYLSQASNLVAYLANKEFWFYDETEEEEIKTPIQKRIHENIGMHVTDIRRKITDSAGEIRYEQVPLPPQRLSVYFNLSYKDGVKNIVKHIQKELGINTDIKEIGRILGFNRPKQKDRLKMITLVELFEFFKACHIDYVNIFDLTCRSCKTRRLNETEIANIGNFESSVSRNTKAFGKTSGKNLGKNLGNSRKSKKPKSKKPKSNRSKSNRSKSKKRI
jgi:hypothetical protein